MKYLQITTTVICGLLAIIALQLRGLRPVTGDDFEKLGPDDAAYQKLQRMMPLINVHRVSSVGEVSVADRIDVEVKNTVDVDVKNKVSVTTGYVDFQNKYENEPLKVEIDR